MSTRNGKDRLYASPRPKSVEEITRAAQEYEYSARIGIKHWLRTAAALLKEADIYEREGDNEQTYFLLFRHAHLVLANLAAHPEAKDKTVRPIFAEAQQEVNKNLKKLDALKPVIARNYERYVEVLRQREALKAANAFHNRSGSEDVASDYVDHISPDSVQVLRAHEHKDLAVELAHREMSRRAASRRAASNAGSNLAGDQEIDLSRQLQEVRARVELGGRPAPLVSHQRPQAASTMSNYKYPTVPTHRTEELKAPSTSQGFFPIAQNKQYVSSPPAVPAKPHQSSALGPPPLPKKILGQLDASSPTKETAYTFTATAHLENGNALRTLFLPTTLRTTFLRLAYSNTVSNLETCAFLAGTLISNALFVSKLIVPAQTSSSDTCEMTNESQLFDYVDSEKDLMILGWIHTHPTQSCFMSSRDLHTHSGYQMMLAESVAIVCAPSKGDTSHGGDWGVYRLTDPPGKQAILKCEKPGIFHPHDVDNIYTGALRPGHVVEAKGLEFDVVDLRE